MHKKLSAKIILNFSDGVLSFFRTSVVSTDLLNINNSVCCI